MKRIDYIDTAKGILIILVIWGHVISECTLRSIITSFHVPAFFMITGILYNYSNFMQRTFLQIAGNKAYKLILPYFFFDFLYIFITNLIGGGEPLRQIKDTLCLRSNVGSLWYLYTLFASEMLFVCFRKYDIDKKIHIGIAMLITPVVICFKQTQVAILIGRILIGWVFITIGYFGFAYFSFCNSKNVVVFSIILLLISAKNGTVDLWSLSFRNPILYFLCALLGTCVTLCISKGKLKLHRWLGFLGKNSLILLGTHKIYLTLLQVTKWYNNIDAIGKSVLVIFIIIAEIPLIVFLNKFLPFFVGKRKNK